MNKRIRALECVYRLEIVSRRGHFELSLCLDAESMIPSSKILAISCSFLELGQDLLAVLLINRLGIRYPFNPMSMKAITIAVTCYLLNLALLGICEVGSFLSEFSLALLGICEVGSFHSFLSEFSLALLGICEVGSFHSFLSEFSLALLGICEAGSFLSEFSLAVLGICEVGSFLSQFSLALLGICEVGSFHSFLSEFLSV
jgi:hypothetical protein